MPRLPVIAWVLTLWVASLGWAQGKQAVPTQEQQAAVAKTIQEVFAGVKDAQVLRLEAGRNKADPAQHYGLLKRGIELASQAHAFDLAFAMIDELDQAFGGQRLGFES